jgi:hypothetical protein
MADSSYLSNIQALQSALAKVDQNSVAGQAIKSQIASLAEQQVSASSTSRDKGDPVERKTPGTGNTTAATSSTTVYGSKEVNVLSKYRSYTYRFTLACLTKDQLDDPKTYNQGNKLDLVILKSGGKRQGAINGNDAIKSQITANNNLLNAVEVSPEETDKATKNIEKLNSYSKLVADFNQYSAGRFDMFIENVQIESMAAFTQASNATLPTRLSFDVIEPYSVNGFLEALSAAAWTAGWTTYIEAPYVLLVEWIGYPDTPGISNPVVLNENRYFTIRFNAMDMSITEKGTVYKCAAYPWNEQVHGITGKLIGNTSVEGDTVGEILSNLAIAFNKQLDVNREQTNKETSQAIQLHDLIDVKFDTVDSKGNRVKDTTTLIGQYDVNNEIAKSELYNSNDARQYAMLDPQSQTSDKPNYPDANAKNSIQISAGTDKKSQIQFSFNTDFRNIIAEVIVNSQYIRSKLKDMDGNGGKESVDANAMVDYFLIGTETEEIKQRDELRNKSLRKYIFRISPYKIHRSKFPGFAKLQQSLQDLQKISCRSYNYIYTGKNTEILDFKLEYNYLFYEAMPKASGVTDSSKTKNTAQPENVTNPTETGKQQTEATRDRRLAVDSAPVSTTAEDPRSSGSAGRNAVQAQGDPYQAMAENLHRALVDPKASMILATIDIMGDPFFLVTGGIGNQSKTDDTNSGVGPTQANHTYGQLIIDIRFQNPQDIGSNGFIAYNPKNNSPFHGAYGVTKITSTFRDGIFKQNLELFKIAGQDTTNTIQQLETDRGITETADSASETTNDARDKSKASVPDTGIPISAFKLGVVSPSSNYANIAGAFGQGPLTQAFGAVTDGAGKLTAGANIYGNAILGGTPSPIINFYPSQMSSKIDSTIANIQGNASSLFPNYIPDPNLRLSGLTGGAVGNAQSYLEAVSNTLPTNVDVSQIISDGLSFRNLKNLSNIPPSQPKTVAGDPEAVLSIDEQQIVAKGGIQGLADVRGVSPSELSASLKQAATAFVATNNKISPLIKFII